MIRKRDLFNHNSLCIFTDSAFRTIKGKKYACAGACIYENDLLIDQHYTILKNSTSQHGELYAIYLGLRLCLRYMDRYKSVKLFSDSLIAILAIRERIFAWMSNIREGQMIGSQNTPILNQTLILSIVDMILLYDISIELYHVKGHINFRDQFDIEESKESFKKFNYICDDIEDSLIRQIAIGNNQIDRYLDYMIKYEIETNEPEDVELNNCVAIAGYHKFDSKKYKKLIGQGG